MLRTANPALNEGTFSRFRTKEGAQAIAGGMTIQGVVNKTAFLLLLLILSAGYIWKLYFDQSPGKSLPFGVDFKTLMMIGGIGGLVIGLVASFLPRFAMVLGPVYVILQGVFLGGLSAFLETIFKGIVMQAVGLTFGTMFGLLFLYKTGIVKVTQNFRLGVISATGGIAIVYLVTYIMHALGRNVPYIHDAGIPGIIFSGFVVVIASLNLVLDFDFVEQGAATGAPKYMEWYAAFGLMVTLVWLYIEILRLLAKIRGRK
jgi:uncharacterized YccA/Bax inhibitor family protein